MIEAFKIIEHCHGGRLINLNYLCDSHEEAVKLITHFPNGIYSIHKVFIIGDITL